MDVDQLVQHYPHLWHTALLDNRTSIREHGLLSSIAILERIGASADEICALTRQRRPDNVWVEGDYGVAVLRDQKPLQRHNLHLNGISEGDWYALLNSRVFFWLSEERLEGMLRAPPYRRQRHLVLKIDTAKLVERHESRVELSRINSGATIFPTAPARGRETFQAIEDYPHPHCPTTCQKHHVAELTVLTGVPDIAAMLLAVETRQHDEPTERLTDL